MFFLKTIRAEKAAKIIAGYCDKCRFADENGDCTLQAKIPSDWEMPQDFESYVEAKEYGDEMFGEYNYIIESPC